MQQQSPHKTFIEVPPAGQGATCRSCGHCPWMAVNRLQNLEQSLLTSNNEILLDAEIIAKAKIPLQRMLDFSYGYQKSEINFHVESPFWFNRKGTTVHEHS